MSETRASEAASSPAASEQQHNPLLEFAQSAAYAAVEEPLRAVAQLVDRTGTHTETALVNGFKVFGIDKPAPSRFGSVDWHAQQLGSAVGMMIPYMLMRGGVRALGAKLLGEAAVSTGLVAGSAARSAVTLAGKEAAISAATGVAYGLALQPVSNTDGASFAWQKIKNGLNQGGTFAAMGFANPLLGTGLSAAAGALERSSMIPALLRAPVAATLRGPVLSGILSGMPGGAASAEINAWSEGRPFASLQEVGEAAYGMSFVGGAFGTAHWLGSQRPGTDNTNARHLSDLAHITRPATQDYSRAQFIVTNGGQHLSKFYSDIRSGAGDAQATIVARQRINGFWGGVLGSAFAPFGNARSTLLSHRAGGSLTASEAGNAQLIATCSALDPALAARDVFPARSTDGGPTQVWLTPTSENGFVVERSETKPPAAAGGQEAVKLGSGAESELAQDWSRQWRQLQDVAAGNGGIPDTVGAQQLVDQIRSLPAGDQAYATQQLIAGRHWPAEIALRDFVIAQPESERLALWQNLHEKAANSGTVVSDLPSIISRLPADQQFSAIASSLEQLGNAAHLPAQANRLDRSTYTKLAASQLAEVLPLLNDDQHYQAFVVGDRALPPDSWNPTHLNRIVTVEKLPDYIRDLSSRPDASHRLSLLSTLAERKLPKAWSDEQRVQYLAECLQAAAPASSVLDSLLPMWRAVRNEPYYGDTPAMAALADQVSPELIVRFLFGKQGRSDEEALISQPDLLRSLLVVHPGVDVAARFNDPAAAQRSTEALRLFRRFQQSGSLSESVQPILQASHHPFRSWDMAVDKMVRLVSQRADEADRQATMQAAGQYYLSPDRNAAATAVMLSRAVLHGELLALTTAGHDTRALADQDFLLAILSSELTGQHKDYRSERLRQYNAWQSSGSIFPALKMGLEYAATEPKTSESPHKAFIEALARHALSTRGASAFVQDYANNVLAADMSNEELTQALRMAEGFAAGRRSGRTPGPFDPGADIAPELQADRSLIENLLWNIMLQPYETPQAVTFARGWRDTHSLAEAWKRMIDKGDFQSKGADEYLPTVVTKIAESAAPEQIQQFIHSAGARLLQGVSPDEAISLANITKLLRRRHPPDNIEGNAGASTTEMAALDAVTPPHQYSQMEPAELHAMLGVLARWGSTNSLEMAWDGISESGIWNESHYRYIFESIAKLAGSLSADEQTRFIKHVAEPLLDNRVSGEHALNILKQIQALQPGEEKGTDQKPSPERDATMTVLSALRYASPDELAARMTFAKAWLSSHSLEEAWQGTSLAETFKDRSGRPNFAGFVSSIVADCPPAEQQSFAEWLEKRILARGNRRDATMALCVLEDLTRKSPELFSAGPTRSSKRSITGDPDIVRQLRSDAVRNYSDAVFSRILDLAQSIGSKVPLTTLYDDALSKSANEENSYLPTWMKLIAQRRAGRQRATLLERLDSQMGTGGLEQSRIALATAEKLLDIDRRTTDAGAPKLALLGDHGLRYALESALACTDVEDAQESLLAIRHWTQERSIPDLAAYLLGRSGHLPERAEVVHGITRRMSEAERDELLTQMASGVNSRSIPVSEVERAVSLLLSIGTAKSSSSFVKTLADKTLDVRNDFSWRMEMSKALSKLQRNGAIEGPVALPSLRMPPLEGVTEARAEAARSQIEQAFAHFIDNPADDGQQVRTLLGRNGELGQMFPQIFGDFQADGGIVGRPQYAPHEDALDDHTIAVFTQVKAGPGFEKLDVKDKMNLLWAALLHDVGKKPGEPDPDHEWASGAYAWSVLQTLGYEPHRIQRIVNLISRHGEVSYHPDEVGDRFATETKVDDFAAAARHPAMPTQLRILNEADIRGINPGQTLFTPAVGKHLDTITERLEQRRRALSAPFFPLLTTAVPNSFGFTYKPSSYVFLMHHTNSVPNFFDNIGSIESRDSSLSTTVVTPSTQRFFHDGASPYKMIIGAPWEHFSMSYFRDRGTGYDLNWQRHVDLMRRWIHDASAEKLAAQVDSKLSALGFGRPDRPLSALADVRRQLSVPDTLDELFDRTQAGDRLRLAHDIVVSALTKHPDGTPLRSLNETKVANPTVQGVALFRNPGGTIAFQDTSGQVLDRLFQRQHKPDWVSGGAPLSSDVTVVPQDIMDRLLRHQRRLVVLDWNRYDIIR